MQGDQSQPRFTVKQQVVVEDMVKTKPGQRKYMHLEIMIQQVEGQSIAFVTMTGENKRRLSNFFGGEHSLHGALSTMIRKRDDIISNLIKQFIADADPMQEATEIDISHHSLTERHDFFLKANVPEVLDVVFDGLKVAANADPIEPHTIKILASHLKGKHLSFEISSANLDWLATTLNVVNLDVPSEAQAVELIYKYIDADWEHVKVSYYVKGKRKDLIFFTMVGEGSHKTKKKFRVTVPKTTLDKFLTMDQAAANEIAEIAEKVAKVAKGGVLGLAELRDDDAEL